MKPRVLFVGEQSGGTVKRPAFGQPIGSAKRLAAILGITHEQMLARYEFINLLSPGKWSARLARQAADEVCRLSFDRAVLLGRKVAEAMGVGDAPMLSRRRIDRRAVLIMPHPSGRNRLFNDPNFVCLCDSELRRFVSGR